VGAVCKRGQGRGCGGRPDGQTKSEGNRPGIKPRRRNLLFAEWLGGQRFRSVEKMGKTFKGGGSPGGIPVREKKKKLVGEWGGKKCHVGGKNDTGPTAG